MSRYTDYLQSLAKTEVDIEAAIIHSVSAHAPSNAQKNSDILKSEIEAKLIGQISSHSHVGSGGKESHITFVSLGTAQSI